MGGEWAAGMPLVIEHWPARLRGIASGLLQGGYSWGYIISAAVFTSLYPALTPYGDIAWRSMFWLGILPGAARALDSDERAREPGLARTAAPPP